MKALAASEDGAGGSLRRGEQKMTSNELREQILAWGASLVGFADLRAAAPSRFRHWPRAVSMAVALNPTAMEGVHDGPTVAYYEEYKRANRFLNELGAKTAEFIELHGYRAEAIAATILDRRQREGFERTLSVGFQHKTAATRAGLGWIGKSALLLTPQYGPRVRLATVVTDLPLEVGVPVTAGRCEGCAACVSACPAGAIKGREWCAGRPREELVDPWACRITAKKLMLERVGVEDSVCGVCVAVCRVGGE
jgi:epoxyqueuosine reductase